MSNHLVILKKNRHLIPKIAEDCGINLNNKKVYMIDIKYITPETFNHNIWTNNWMFAYDVLTNGDLFGEVYILLLNKKEDLNLLYKEQVNVIKENAFIAC